MDIRDPVRLTGLILAGGKGSEDANTLRVRMQEIMTSWPPGRSTRQPMSQ